MAAIRIGSALIERVMEQSLAIPLGLMTDDRALLARCAASLPNEYFDEDSMTFRFSSHTWVIQVDGLNVLIDPCTGNDRSGLGPHFDALDVPYLDRLAEIGVSAEDADIVFCTHLHHDHCGWNTMQVDGVWVPTFPNATYFFVEEEYQRWDTAHPPHANEYNPNTFDTCVRPIVDAGQAEVVSTPHDISPSLTIEAAPGHTLGHAMVRLASDGAHGYFTGDAFHHPIQLTRPELHLPGCDDLAEAISTRRSIVRRALDEDAFLFPAHFPDPHYGQVSSDGDEVYFVSGGAAESGREPVVSGAEPILPN